MSRDPDPLVVAGMFLMLSILEAVMIFKLDRAVEKLTARVTALEACQ